MNTTASAVRAVIVDGSSAGARAKAAALERGGLCLDWERVETLDELVDALQREVDLVVLARELPDFDWPRAVRAIRELHPTAPLVLMAGAGDTDGPVQSARSGGDLDTLASLEHLLPVITRRHQADGVTAPDRIHASEACYRAIFSAVNDGIFIMDGMRFVECNPRTGEILGVEVEELIGASPLDFSPELQPDGTPSSVMARGKVDATLAGEPQRFEWRHVRPDGALIDADVTLSPFGLGGRTYVLATVSDITAQREAERNERQRHAILEGILEGTEDVAFVKDLQGYYVYVNRAFAAQMDMSADDIVGRDMWAIWPAAEAERRAEEDREILESGAQRCYNEAFGGRHYITTKGVYRDAEGQPLGVFGLARDVTEAQRDQLRMRLQSEALDASSDSVFLLDADGAIIYVNSSFERITGYHRDEVIGRHCTPAFARAARENPGVFEEIWDTLRAGDSFRGIVTKRAKDNTLFQEHLSIAPVFDNVTGEQYYVAIGRDLSEQMYLQQQLEEVAYYDPLTGHPNRALLLERTERALERASAAAGHVGLLMIDLNRFRMINDSLGHESGDEVLRTTAFRLRSCGPSTATLARVGADEFGMLIEDCEGASELLEIIDEIQVTLGAYFRIEGQQIGLTASVGASLSPEDGTTGTELLRNADTAMYHAKRSGQSSYCFYSDQVRDAARQQLTLEADLRRAMEHERLELHYQPEIDLRTGDVCGVEALLRWRRPEQGLIPPGEFIAAAEETGLINEMGAWVLRRACRFAADSPGLHIAVNISGRHFEAGGLAELVGEVLEDTALDPSRLQLEITEGTFISEVEAAARQIQALRDLGVHLAIDDFGTGYSSLAYLRRFPVDSIKIDRSFIRNIESSEEDRGLVSAAIAMAHHMRCQAIAEGVETEGQAALLKELGCDIVQGFLYARPMPAADLQAWLTQCPTS